MSTTPASCFCQGFGQQVISGADTLFIDLAFCSPNSVFLLALPCSVCFGLIWSHVAFVALDSTSSLLFAATYNLTRC
jgi:hypothetical protein